MNGHKFTHLFAFAVWLLCTLNMQRASAYSDHRNHKTDSLETLLKNESRLTDEQRMDAYKSLMWAYLQTDGKRAAQYARKAIALSYSHDWQNVRADAQRILGMLLTATVFCLLWLGIRQKRKTAIIQARLDGEIAERIRIARDLHDRLGGLLTALKLRLPPHTDTSELVDQAIREMRNVSHHLQPDSLSRYGLRTALRDFCTTMKNVSFAFVGEEQHIAHEEAIYCIVYELVNNAVKSAHAQHISVQLLANEEYTAVNVSDDGIGLNEADMEQGTGMTNIRERLAAIGGKLDIATTPGKGTEINIEIKNEKKTTKIIIADDHTLVAEAVALLLANDVECCGIAVTLAEAETMLAAQRPDVLLLDIALPDGDGIDALPRFMAASPMTRILMLTMYAEPAVIKRALGSGAHGYLLKSADGKELNTAIRTLAEGGTYICKEAENLAAGRLEEAPVLTMREREILRLMVAGMSIKKMANKLCLGFETIHTYTKYLRQKLGCNNTASLVRTAIEQHLV